MLIYIYIHIYLHEVANIRGGGEFGPQWHQAALKQNRIKAYQDFIAVAEDLVRIGITSPHKLAIRGGSNGGLLMGNMMVKLLLIVSPCLLLVDVNVNEMR